ncbi:type II toxin-antitoxin system PemK/MazF family toxin [Mucilaginibacter sp. UYCu711]|uniref:type II toxin-antitoxin system PemK/MazF family toxin n=1 Tax=Mucilaginibacter sp. UYCu711 TaxID=3156339 RepID=UPI003D21BE27
MNNYKLGDIVLIKFPFTDNTTFKKRPALIIKDTNDGDIIVCRITSKLYNTPYDIELKEWDKYGLKLPSVIRIHKLASLEKAMVDFKFGEIDSDLLAEVVVAMNKLTAS